MTIGSTVCTAFVATTVGLSALACSDAFASCEASYCGSIGHETSIRWQENGFGYSYTGTVTLTFDPPPPAGMTIAIQLNAASIGGQATTNGSATLNVPFGGSSVACQLTNPSTWLVWDVARPRPVLAILEFSWDRGGGCD